MVVDSTAMTIWEPDQNELDVFRKHFAPEKTTDTEWLIFVETCKTYRVSPMRKQIYLVGRYDSQKNRMVNTPQISIGGLRALALRTGEFEGTTEPEWGDEDGNWYTLWPKRLGAHPYAARIGVYRKGFRAPKWGVAYFEELAQRKSERNGGGLTKFWNDMGKHMILKCAEADALRGAFEEQCGGLYIHEEMNQADADSVVVSVVPEPAPDETNDALKETAGKKRQLPPAAKSPEPAQAQRFAKVAPEPAQQKQPEQKPASQPETKASNFPMTHGELVKELESAELIDEVTGRAVDLDLLIDITERKFASAGKHFNVAKIKGMGSEIGPKTCHILELMLNELKAAKKAQGTTEAA